MARDNNPVEPVPYSHISSQYFPSFHSISFSLCILCSSLIILYQAFRTECLLVRLRDCHSTAYLNDTSFEAEKQHSMPPPLSVRFRLWLARFRLSLTLTRADNTWLTRMSQSLTPLKSLKKATVAVVAVDNVGARRVSLSKTSTHIER